jgi:hypothetical protein
MPIHHVTYAMPNARNAQRKLYICYKGAPTHPPQEIKHTPSSPRKRVKVAWSRSLVKISASWSCVGTWIKVIFPFSTLSLRKWHLTSMCLVLEWRTRFFATLMALVLSHWSGTWVYSSPKSLMVYVIQRSWEQQLAAATYSASVGIEQRSTVCGKIICGCNSSGIAVASQDIKIVWTREGGREWESIKILLEGDGGSNKMNTTSNTRLRLTTQVGQDHVATGVLLDLGTNNQTHRL